MQQYLQTDHAPSGVPSMPTVSWGSHICHLFDSADHLRDVLVPYFKAGLENGERCLWVADSPFCADEARAAMREVVHDLDEREAKGQIEIKETDAFYDRARPLQPEAIVTGLLAREASALAEGYRGLRTNGNCAWVGEGNFESFLNYEAGVHVAVRGRRMICMCSYSNDCLEPLGASEVLARHDIVLPSPRQSLPDTPTRTAGLPEQFLAVLGHDLRNPIAAITAGANLLRKREDDPRKIAIIDRIETSASNMAELVEDVLDVRRTRLGTGLSLRLSLDGLEEALRHVVEEARLIHPDREIVADIVVEPGKISADPHYVARLLSNLLKNALTYGSQIDPVTVVASTDSGFSLSVINKGSAIAENVRASLFSPFTRGTSGDRAGLGLGLFIVSEIARAHGGTIEVSSDAGETRFSFCLSEPS
jgi:signal transduction histidine kinase